MNVQLEYDFIGINPRRMLWQALYHHQNFPNFQKYFRNEKPSALEEKSANTEQSKTELNEMFLNWSAKDRFRSALTFIISGFLALSPLKQLTIAKQIMKGLAKILACCKHPNVSVSTSVSKYTLFSTACCYLDQKILTYQKYWSEIRNSYLTIDDQKLSFLNLSSLALFEILKMQTNV